MNLPTWAKIEIMGHRYHYGLVSEVERFGGTMCLVQVPEPVTGLFVEEYFYGANAIFCITKMSEESVVNELKRRAEWNRPVASLPAHENDDSDDDDNEPHDTERPPADSSDVDPEPGF